MRIKSLKAFHRNYTATLDFFKKLTTDCDVDSGASARSKRFIKHLQSFKFYFLLTMTINIFERIENLNTGLKKSDICIDESHAKVKIVSSSLAEMRESKFD